MSKRGCPGCTSSLFLTCTLSTVPDTSAATGTTKAWILAWEVYGVRRSEMKYQARLATISISTMIAPRRDPFPGSGGGDCSTFGAGVSAGMGGGGAFSADFSPVGTGVSFGLVDSWLMVLPFREGFVGHQRPAPAAEPSVCPSSRCVDPWFRASRHPPRAGCAP